MVKANKQRGEVLIEGPGGEKFKLCLTLGAIAQIEDRLEGIDSLSQMDKVMSHSRMKDVVIIFVALLNGGGHEDIGPQDMMKWATPLQELMGKINEAFAAAGFEEEEGGETKEGDSSGN